MPNARVGAMPNQSAQQQSSKDRKNGRRKENNSGSSGRKGITIEDLKQQTALRLAKQQESRQRKNTRGHHQRQQSNQVPNPNNPNPHALHHDPPRSHALQYTGRTNTNPAPGGPSHTQSLNHSPHHTHVHNQGHVNSPPHQQHHFPSFESEQSSVSVQSTDLSAKNCPKVYHHHHNSNAHHGHSSPHTPVAAHAQHLDHHPAHRPSLKNYDHNTKYGSDDRSCSSSSNNRGKCTPKGTKLPHGLTVQELKEMTRARLANEAGEGVEIISPGEMSSGGSSHYNRQRVYSHDILHNDAAVRQRLGSEDSFRSAPPAYTQGVPASVSKYHHSRYSDQKYPGSLAKSRSSSRLNYGVGYHPTDANDNTSVASFGSGLGSQSHLGSDTSTWHTAASSSRDLAKTMTFPVGSGSNLVLETDMDQLGSFMTCASFDTGSRRMTERTGLSNLLEDKPFSPAIGGSFSEEEGFGFTSASMPTTPTIPRTGFVDNVLSDILCQQPTTPSTGHSQSLSASGMSHDENITQVLPSGFERQVSRGGEVPNAVAESVLGSLEAEPDTFQDYKLPIGRHSQNISTPDSKVKAQDPWKEQDIDALSSFSTNWERMLNLETNQSGDEFPFSSFPSKASENEPDWKSVEGQPLTPSSPSNIVISENFHDDGEDFPVSPTENAREGESDISSAKVVNKKRSASRWKFR